MKRFSFLLLFLPAICFGDSLSKQVTNNYDWSIGITASADVAWQVYNSSNNTNTTFVTSIDLASDKGGYFVIYSTDVARTSFTGSKIGRSISPSHTGSAAVAASSATTCASASSPTGDIRWQGVVSASETINVPLLWSLKPGQAIYVLKANRGASEAATASFRLVETYR